MRSMRLLRSRTDMHTYKVAVTRDDRWWMITVPELAGYVGAGGAINVSDTTQAAASSTCPARRVASFAPSPTPLPPRSRWRSRSRWTVSTRPPRLDPADPSLQVRDGRNLRHVREMSEAADAAADALRAAVAEARVEQILLDKLFTTWGEQVQGGIFYSVVKASDFYTTDVEKRSPAIEYRVVGDVNPEAKLGVVEHWGGNFQVPQEVITCNQVAHLDQQITQLSNTLAKKLDVAALAMVEAANPDSIIGNDWDALVMVGPADSITKSSDRPTADLSAAQLAADLQELGVKHNLLIVHPSQAHALRTAYGDNLGAMLESAGVELLSNPRLTAGTAYVCERGGVGTVGFEFPVSVDIWESKATRSWLGAGLRRARVRGRTALRPARRAAPPPRCHRLSIPL